MLKRVRLPFIGSPNQADKPAMEQLGVAGGCWPTPEQELLLHAALDQGPSAVAAWTAWRAGGAFDRLDQASYRLLPLVYRTLRAAGSHDPHLGFLRGTHRRTWHDNRLLFHHLKTLVRAFNVAGLPTIVLKGPALTVLYYQDYGLRPMSDFDLLVPTDQARPALDLLTERGFHASQGAGKDFNPMFLSVINGFGFADAAGAEVDLHWHLLAECCWPTADEDFWAGAIPLTIDAVPTLALNPADQLLHTCVHGLRWNPVPPMRWVADALILLRAAPELDWPRVVRLAQKLHVGVSIREALHYLARVWAAPIPPDTLSQLAQLPVSPAEVVEFDLINRPMDTLGPTQRLWLHYQRYLRTARPTRLRDQPLGLARYLQHAWGLESLAQVPTYVLGWGLGRVKRLLPHA